jgi:hypothetical protein
MSDYLNYKVYLVCKHWYDVAKIVWSSKKRLDLTEAKIFDGYMPPQKDNPYGFKKKPSKALHNLNLFYLEKDVLF